MRLTMPDSRLASDAAGSWYRVLLAGGFLVAVPFFVAAASARVAKAANSP